MKEIPNTILGILLLSGLIYLYAMSHHHPVIAGGAAVGKDTLVRTAYYNEFDCNGMATVTETTSGIYANAKVSVAPSMGGCSWVKSYQANLYATTTPFPRQYPVETDTASTAPSAIAL